MMDAKALTELTRQIMKQGYGEATASHFAVLIGDRPCRDEAGNLIVFEGGKEIARLKPLDCFD